MGRKGNFDKETLTIKFGGALSKPHAIFTATAIKVPDYKYKVKERESLGNGWYGSMEVNEYTQDNLYIVIKDGVCIGSVVPYMKDIKSEIFACNKEAMALVKQLGLKYEPKGYSE